MLGIPDQPGGFRPWRERALCRPDRDWFPNENDHRAISDLKAICAACPVRTECLDDAISYPKTSDRWGVFGGLTPDERNVIRKHRKRTQERPVPRLIRGEAS